MTTWCASCTEQLDSNSQLLQPGEMHMDLTSVRVALQVHGRHVSSHLHLSAKGGSSTLEEGRNCTVCKLGDLMVRWGWGLA